MGSPRDYLDAHPSTALLVVEVSDTSLVYDRTTKMSLYAKAGIQEYWVINLNDRRLEVFRDPGVQPRQTLGYGYSSVSAYHATDEIAPSAMRDDTLKVADLLP